MKKSTASLVVGVLAFASFLAWMLLIIQVDKQTGIRLAKQFPAIVFMVLCIVGIIVADGLFFWSWITED